MVAVFLWQESAAIATVGKTGPTIWSLLEFEGWHIWLTHGYKYLQDGGLDDLVWWGKNFGVQIVVFGHTHVPLFKKVQGIYLFNPGSPSRPRGGSKAGFGVLTLKKGVEPEAQFIHLSDGK
jgi:putative phosphoesterase